MRLPLLAVAVIVALSALALPIASTSSVTTTAATAATVAAPNAGETAAPLIGTYDCQGVEPDGTPYRGVVQIIPSAGTYDVIWIFSNGQQYSGLGVVNGDVLAVSYFTNRPGVVAYKIEQSEKGPRLEGEWTVVGAGKVFHETLTRLTAEVKRADPPSVQERRPRTPTIMRHLRPA